MLNTGVQWTRRGTHGHHFCWVSLHLGGFLLGNDDGESLLQQQAVIAGASGPVPRRRFVVALALRLGQCGVQFRGRSVVDEQHDLAEEVPAGLHLIHHRIMQGRQLFATIRQSLLGRTLSAR
jgi:hypothetical protein